MQGVALNPDHHYNPKFAWEGVEADHELAIKPGSNNPVELVWIDLLRSPGGRDAKPTIGNSNIGDAVRPLRVQTNNSSRYRRTYGAGPSPHRLWEGPLNPLSKDVCMRF